MDSISKRSFQAPEWYQAFTLKERRASLVAAQHTEPKVKIDADLAERKMRRWRSQPPFTTGSFFTRRLEMETLTEDEFLHFLGEPIEAVRDRFPAIPGWLAKLTQAFSHPPTSEPLPLPEELRKQPEAGFLAAIAPLIHQGRDFLRQGIQSISQTRYDLPFDPGTIEDILLANLPYQLIMMISRTMVLELNIARLQGLLPGDTAEERFCSFLERICQPDLVLAIFHEYPVLARQLVEHIDIWANLSLEFLRHLCSDWDEIRTTFSPGSDPGVLIQVKGHAGDSHRGGRSVLITTFRSGLKIVYRPKSLAVDVHFQELLAWLNEHGDHPPFRAIKILNCGLYGWVEFVAAESCTSQEEIKRFYIRQGSYLALLYALKATDFHFENLIAAGEHPVLVDLETLFHSSIHKIDPRQSNQLAGNTLYHSVLSIGLLPQRTWANEESEGIDLSGLGGTGGQITPFGVPQWENAGKDEMRLIRKRIPLSGQQNRPTLNGTEVCVQDYTEEIIAGFTNMYHLLLRHYQELLSDNGPLTHFAEDEVRVILRSTQTYYRLLYASFHPDVLRNALDRDRLFDRLWVSVEQIPNLARVIRAECEDLRKGDIPFFSTRPGSCDLWSSAGERIADFFDEPGLSLARRRLQGLSEDNLSQQLWFIRASLATLSISTISMNASRVQRPNYHPTESQSPADRDRLLTAAQAIGDQLERLALRGEHDVSWIGLTISKDRYWALLPAGVDLYDGLAGIAFFLAYLGKITRQARYTELAQVTLATLRNQVTNNQSFITSIGGYSGWGGIIYTLTHLGSLWDQPSLLDEAEAIVKLLPPLIEKDESLDVIAGAAGCIASLACLLRCRPSPDTLAAAIQCGERLLACAQSMEQGRAWTITMWTKPLAGFSHGAGGIAWALLELASLTGEKRFRAMALEAIAYERSLFDPKEGNWQDVREMEIANQAANGHQASFMSAWCHGAPGIGMARLSSLKYMDDPAIREEIDIALKTTLSKGFGFNHSLCHGDLGNLELLLLANETLEDGEQWRDQAYRIAAIILESINRDGWICGVPLRVEVPGLMTGIAGIGYELLRLAEPARVPSVLVLAPPLKRS
ncbi:MAG: type 2 lanthipeptide synthetase LanM family protein [bacterium]